MVERTFIVQGQDLARITKWAEKATDTLTATNSVIVVKIKESRLFMQAYNGTRSVETATSITQNFPDDIRFTVNSQLLSEAVKKMEKFEIKGSFERTKLILTTTKPRMKYILPVHVPQTVNELPKMSEKAGIVDTKTFKNAVTDVNLAVVSEDTGMPVLESIKMSFQPQNKTIDFIATNRYIVVNRIIPYEPNPEASQEDFHIFIKPQDIKDALSNIVDEETVNLFAQPKGNNIFGVGTNIALMGTLTININQSPNLKMWFSNIAESNITLPRADIITALTNLRSSGSGGGVVIAYLNFDDEVMTIESDPVQQESRGSGFEMEIDVIEHSYPDGFKIKTNAQFLIDVLRANKAKNVKMAFNPDAVKKPIIVFEMDDNGKANPQFNSVFMPLSG